MIGIHVDVRDVAEFRKVRRFQERFLPVDPTGNESRVSSCSDPAPMPRITRPPDSRSSDAINLGL
jgi:hypothetical protein